MENRYGEHDRWQKPGHESSHRDGYRVAPTPIPILLVGETGTGKNLIARSIHDLSQRKGGRFVIMDGATMNDNLMESELFGHEKGAFTNATATKIGRIEMANGGTLFLNEVQNLSLEMQGKLLEVVEIGRNQIQSLQKLFVCNFTSFFQQMSALTICTAFMMQRDSFPKESMCFLIVNEDNQIIWISLKIPSDFILSKLFKKFATERR